ncbi:putative Major facilitator superfamily domain-containing protein [Seiridium unicorne]|uniref:Major facilitator superfamily domain-containing protein n=1 Tax=Seiridium unicorne TaxID=138068 RepID=A0ABR2UUR3_9PEZI
MTTNHKTEIIPGTDIVFRETNTGEGNATEELVLIPQPTDNADDPLNWTPTWKTIVIVNQFIFTFVSIMTPLCISPLTIIFEQEFNKSLPEVNMLFGAAAITLGYANFLIVPAANVFGRRPVLLICGLICILANIWQALVTSYPSFIGARIISGLGAAANESLMPMVVADVLFLHQRGKSMAFYFWAYFMGLFIGPIISGAIASRINWRWFHQFWVCTILQAVSFIFVLVAHPETKYDRSAISETSGVSVLHISENKNKPTDTHDSESSSPRPSIATAIHHSQALGNGRPSRAQFSVVPRPRFTRGGFRSVIRDVVSPIQILFYPIVLWAAFAMGFAANSLLALNITQAQVFAAPPFLFTPDQIGLINFAFVIGAAIALVTAGPFSDWVALRKARKNGGVLEAEFRLPALIPYVAINLIGMVITAVGYQRSWPWAAIVVAGYMLIGIQVVGIPAIAIAYAVDCYKALPGEIMIAATIMKNTFGFGMIFYINDWAARDGFLAPILMVMTLTVGFSVLGLAVFMPFGKKFRRMTKDSKLHAL